MKTQTKFYRLVLDSLALIAIANRQSLKRRDVDEDWCQILYANSRTVGTNRNANSEYIKMKGCGWRLRLKFMDQFMKKIKYASSEWSGEAAHLRSLARAFAEST